MRVSFLSFNDFNLMFQDEGPPMTQEKYTNVQNKLVFDFKNRHQPLFSKISKGNVERQRGTGVFFLWGEGRKKFHDRGFWGQKCFQGFEGSQFRPRWVFRPVSLEVFVFFLNVAVELELESDKKKVLQVAPNLFKVDKCRTKRTKWNEMDWVGEKRISPFRSHRLFRSLLTLLISTFISNNGSFRVCNYIPFPTEKRIPWAQKKKTTQKTY